MREVSKPANAGKGVDVSTARRVTFAASIETIESGRVTLREEAVARSEGFAAALLPYVGERHVLITIELDRADAQPPPAGRP